MPSLTVENYCKAVYQLDAAGESGWVTTGRLAEALRVSPGTVTSMLKTLAESGLVEYRPYEGVRLTRSGQSLALRMLRRHRLLELFLVRTLDLSWDEVHEEAEHMEHAVSDALVDRIDEFLGKPDYDPHGDPIPRPDGTLRGAVDDAVPLTACPEGSQVRIVRVLRQSARFLRGLSDSGIGIGVDARIEHNNASTGVVTLRIDGRDVSVGHTVADELLVQPADRDDQPS
jgi:DtxR family transcriptional regulator, Mn-dependent transcriptional regulator